MNYLDFEKIAQQNDHFRSLFGVLYGGDTKVEGKYELSEGIRSLPCHDLFAIIKGVAIMEFDRNEDTPREHSGGEFSHNGHDVFWIIQYYDKEYKGSSPDPFNLTKTCRILTVMLKHEY